MLFSMPLRVCTIRKASVWLPGLASFRPNGRSVPTLVKLEPNATYGDKLIHNHHDANVDLCTIGTSFDYT